MATVGPVLLAFAAWTLFVWGTRISNILSDAEADGASKALDLTVAVALSVLALAVLWVAVTSRRSRSHVPADTAADRRASGLAARHGRHIVGTAAAATVAVWAVRTPLLLAADHGAAFKAVHAALALVSVALAYAAWRTTSRFSAQKTAPGTVSRAENEVTAG